MGPWSTTTLAEQAERVQGRVDPKTQPLLPYVGLEHIAAGAKSFLECGLDRAYCGTPSEATAEEGHSTLAVLAELTLEMVRERLGDKSAT